LVSEFVSLLLVADVYISLDVILCRRSHFGIGGDVFESSHECEFYSQQPSPRSFVYVRTRISTAEHRVSEAAWAVQGILNICLKNKEEIYNQLSPFARCINCFSSQDKQAIGQSIHF
jgi:hypothetical protein